MSNTPVCKFWLKGNCKFGDKCRFAHPRNNTSQFSQPQSGHQTQPQQNALASRISGFGGQAGPRGGNDRYFEGGRGGRGAGDQRTSGRQNNFDTRKPRKVFGVTVDTVETDLSIGERPTWMMSCYGPGIDAPIQLFGDFPLEQSPEELRYLYQQAKANNNVEAYIKNELDLAQAANQQYQNVINDVPGALQYLADGEHQHPNRLDVMRDLVPRGVRHGLFTIENQRRGNGIFTEQFQARKAARNAANQNTSSNGFQGNAGNNFSQGFANQNTTFSGQPPSSGFSSGGNGSALSGFNQQSQMNNPQLQPSFANLGQGQGSFTSNAAGVGFNQNQSGNGFATSAPFTQSVQQNLPSNEFSSAQAPFAMQQPSGNSLIGQPGQNIQQASNSSFGPGLQPFNVQSGNTAFPSQQPNQNAFAATAHEANTNILGQAAPQQQTNGAFDGIQNQQASHNSFTNSNGAPVQLNSTFSNPIQSNNNQSQCEPANDHTPPLSTYAQFDVHNRLTSWKGQPVLYEANEPFFRRPDGGLERIWFPHGAPGKDLNVQNSSGMGSDDNGEAWSYLRQNGSFKDDIMPDVAPGVSDLRWDL